MKSHNKVSSGSVARGCSLDLLVVSRQLTTAAVINSGQAHSGSGVQSAMSQMGDSLTKAAQLARRAKISRTLKTAKVHIAAVHDRSMINMASEYVVDLRKTSRTMAKK